MAMRHDLGAIPLGKEGHTHQSAAVNDLNTNNTPIPQPAKTKSQRELRGLRALANNPNGVYRHDMDIAVGAQNSPEYISRLRLAGWHITTERIPMIDRDGRKVRVGRYRLDSSQRDFALKIVEGLQCAK